MTSYDDAELYKLFKKNFNSNNFESLCDVIIVIQANHVIHGLEVFLVKQFWLFEFLASVVALTIFFF